MPVFRNHSIYWMNGHLNDKAADYKHELKVTTPRPYAAGRGI